MTELLWRTEDIPEADLLKYFVETTKDRQIVDALKGRNPIVLVGSRGVGKSFLLRVAEVELRAAPDQSVHPVYVSFTKSSLVSTSDPKQFEHWMLARLCERVVRSLKKRGLLAVAPQSISILTGGGETSDEPSPIEQIAEKFENSWQAPGQAVDLTGLPSVDDFKDAIEDICESLSIKRMAIFFDEAAHVFQPDQQRQFFTLFRDLRSPYITCNAAVYPGVTAYGDTFQPVHDATLVDLERDILSEEYVPNMREMVEKQGDSDLLSHIARQGANFAVLAYAANGNPRLLLKTLYKAPTLRSKEVTEVIREYYRHDIWSDHSALAEKYRGHRPFIDWGRKFIEDSVLPALHSKNEQYLKEDKKTSCFFWIHRDAPAQAKEAIRLLAYTGIVTSPTTGIRATRSEVGTRYSVNLGCLLALQANPAATALEIAQNLTPKRMTEYGANHPEYAPLIEAMPSFKEPDGLTALQEQLDKKVGVLDLTSWQKAKLRSLKLRTIRQVLNATEDDLKRAYYVGDVRARQMRNAAMQAIMEYLSG